MIDYRELLKTYMNHVGDCEGTFFLGRLFIGTNFSEEEKSELLKIEEELNQEWIDAYKQ